MTLKPSLTPIPTLAPMGLKTALGAVVLLLAAACGGEPAAGSSSTQANDTPGTVEAGSTATLGTLSPGSADLGSCTITVTGDIELTETFEQDVFSIVTDFWLTEDDAQDSFEFMKDEGSTETYDDRVASGQPVISWFAFSCAEEPGTDPTVLAYPTNATTRDQFPMAPGSYPVSGGTSSADGPAGTYVVNLFVEGDVVFEPVPGSGTLDIETWDSTRVTGTMTFDAAEAGLESGDRQVSVQVGFDFLCTHFHSSCR